MRLPSHQDAYQVLVLQAADEGRGPVLFGESLQRARTEALPFLVGEAFPDIYLECPLVGDPFIDVTVLYNRLEPGTRIESPAAGEHGALFDWLADTFEAYEGVSAGFELDTKEDPLPVSAIHFQPRASVETVRPFFEKIGEPERADLYLDLAKRMPDGWGLSFFGLFRGRPDYPLRVCGYMGGSEKEACAKDASNLESVFDRVGFTAYDDTMLRQVRQILEAAPSTVDFQFDVFPDGSLGPVFAIDVRFGAEQPEALKTTFGQGDGARVMGLLEGWGAADERWRMGIDAAFARCVPVELDDGAVGRFAFTIMPQWFKARWTNCVLQPSKLYYLAKAKLLDDEQPS